MEYVVMGVVAGLGQAAAHWFPWRTILGKRLPRIWAYVIGALLMLSPLAIWFALTQQWGAMIGLVTVAAASGGVVITTYAIDASAENKAAKEIIGKYRDG